MGPQKVYHCKMPHQAISIFSPFRIAPSLNFLAVFERIESGLMKRLFFLACANGRLSVINRFDAWHRFLGIVFEKKKKGTPLLQLARYSPLPIAHLYTCDQESRGMVAATDHFIAA